MTRLPWSITFVRPHVTGRALLRRGVPDVIEVTLPLRGPDDDARVTIDRSPVPAHVSPFAHDSGTVTVRLNEREAEFIAFAYMEARHERKMDEMMQEFRSAR